MSAFANAAADPPALIWIEGENPTESNVNRHSWYSGVDHSQLSGGNLLSHFDDNRAGEASYQFACKTAGDYELWLRTNPILSSLSFSLNGALSTSIDLQKGKRDEINIAADKKPDLRFLAWIKVGRVRLRQGGNRMLFHFNSEKHHHGYLDCFVFSATPILPRGALKPVESREAAADESAGWFAFEPGSDKFEPTSAIDLRYLNEQTAGEQGQITARDGQFYYATSNRPVRFWAVNGPPENLHGEDLQRCARMLAKYGVNLVRVHGAVFDKNGEADLSKVRRIHEVVRTMKDQGIYTHLSIYFPLWFTPSPELAWLPGYNGNQHPFAALFFNAEFQKKHREWIQVLLTTPDEVTGKALLAEPALFGLELQNEDSLFFWTFNDANIPEPQLEILERQFGEWLAKKFGSLNAAIDRWKSAPLKRDNLNEGRVAFRPLWNLFNDRTPRDQDTVAFLFEVQDSFYRDSTDFVRGVGFQGLINTSNWTTASPERLTPLEKLTYLNGDFVDRHGYFECNHKGENAAWSIRQDHSFSHRSALRFEPNQPDKPRLFVHPVMDPQYNDKPSIISETTFTRPNRFRSEAPLYFATYGALQDTDAIVHFAFDGAQWDVKPGFWMQPWTLATPSMLAQFPAAALIYRQRLIATGELLASVTLNQSELLALQGTPLPQDASFDELRLKDIPTGTSVNTGQRIDPLIHYAGRTQVTFTHDKSQVTMKDLSPLIDHKQQTVKSVAGDVNLHYGTGLLKLSAPNAQGASGALNSEKPINLPALRITCPMDLAHIVAVSLDNAPLSTSKRILLQVMSEEQTTGFETVKTADNLLGIVNIGTDPWRVRQLQGRVELLRKDAQTLVVVPLDLNGYPTSRHGTADCIELLPDTLYYLITTQQ